MRVFYWAVIPSSVTCGPRKRDTPDKIILRGWDRALLIHIHRKLKKTQSIKTKNKLGFFWISAAIYALDRIDFCLAFHCKQTSMCVWAKLHVKVETAITVMHDWLYFSCFQNPLLKIYNVICLYSCVCIYVWCVRIYVWCVPHRCNFLFV